MQHDLINYSHYYTTIALYSLCQMSLIIEIPLLSTYICQFAGVTIASPLPEFNIYDIREPCVTMGLCYPDDKLGQVLNSDDYLELLFTEAGHEKPSNWEMCATVPHLTLLNDHNKSWGYKLAPLLDAGMPILVYNGNQDYICNSIGAEMWTNALVWNGQENYNNASFEEYRMNKDFVGLVKNAGNLTLMIVFGAGHMVPMDQPQVALHMI